MSGPGWHGLLNLDKPSGSTSRDVVDRVQRLVGRKVKIGHAGTLDPLASGVLVVCLGAATRLVDRVQEHPKGYLAGFRLGMRSDTDDLTGKLEPGADPSGITPEQIRDALGNFTGQISQVPPQFSAVHVGGRRAYDLARKGETFRLTERTVQVHAASLLGYQAGEGAIEIVCGSGTYIRSLIRDLGERLDCGAIMTALRRTFIGPFDVEHAAALEDLTLARMPSLLLPMKSVLQDDIVYEATSAECAALLQGRAIPDRRASPRAPDERIVVLDETGELFAFAQCDAERGLLLPRQVFTR